MLQDTLTNRPRHPFSSPRGITKREGRWMLTSGHKARDVSNISHEVGTHLPEKCALRERPSIRAMTLKAPKRISE